MVDRRRHAERRLEADDPGSGAHGGLRRHQCSAPGARPVRTGAAGMGRAWIDRRRGGDLAAAGARAMEEASDRALPGAVARLNNTPPATPLDECLWDADRLE